jgi:hypothetical protein
MAYVAIGRIAGAIKSLQRFHAFFGITFLSMKRAGMVTGNPISWGSEQENELLAKHYSPPGAPADKTYFVPFGRPDPKSGFWKNPKYSGGTLQRARTTDNFKDGLQHPTRDTWSFTDNYLDVFENLLPKEGNDEVRLPIFDLIAWLYRDRDLPAALTDVVKLFRDEFHIQDIEYKRLFDANDENPAHFFFADPVDRNELIQVIGGVPDGPSMGTRTEEDLVKFVEEYVTKTKLIALPAGFVRAFYFALKTQRFVVLAGRPGTGKTAFARAFAEALGKFFPNAVTDLIVSIGPDFSESDVLGYEKIAGDLAATELTRRLFLSCRPRDIYVVVLDEMNIAQVDHYLARILPAIESDAPVELPGQTGRVELPPDTFIVGTINSFVEESTRLALSGPVKRRANVVEMPNLLATLVDGDDRAGFERMLVDLMRQTQDRYKARKAAGQASVLDAFRIGDLETALLVGSRLRAGGVVDALWGMCRTCAEDSQTSLTFGVLQDVVDYIAMTPGNPMLCLDRQIAQKVVPQLAGPGSVARKLLHLIDTLRSSECSFEHSSAALAHLIRTEDPSSGVVYFRY